MMEGWTAGHLAFFSFISEMKNPHDYPKVWHMWFSAFDPANSPNRHSARSRSPTRSCTLSLRSSYTGTLAPT